MRNRQWILTSHPTGDLTRDNLKLQETSVPTPGQQQFVMKTHWVTIDPAARLWVEEEDNYMPTVKIGQPMRAFAIGTVVESQDERFPVGVRAMGTGSMSEYIVGNANYFSVVPDIEGVSAKDFIGYYYISGPTAYFGMVDIGKPQIGDTVVVSSAAGSIGSVAVQLALAMNTRVIGIAGGPEKCRYVTKLGAEACIDYKSEDIQARLKELCPQGVDVFFDNVAGETLNSVVLNMNNYGRVVQCGFVSGYADGSVNTGPRNYAEIGFRRLLVQGYVVVDKIPRYPEAYRALTFLRNQGKLNWQYHQIDGIENAPNGFDALWGGRNIGKVIVSISEEASV